MNLLRKLFFAVALLGVIGLAGCDPLKKMMKLAEEQELTVVPSPLEVHADTVAYTASVKLPVKMLKSGLVYTVTPYYEYDNGTKKAMMDRSVSFDGDNITDGDVNEPTIEQSFKFPYEEGMNPGKLFFQGTAKEKRSGKELEGPALPVADGLILTSKMVESVGFAAYAPHMYNDKEELMPKNVEFFFAQGSSVLRTSEKRSDRGDDFSAFVAAKNVTRTVTITGTHSPEGSERINADLAQNRAEAIEKYYRSMMDRYDYGEVAEEINFITKDVVENWDDFKAMLRDYEGITAAQKDAILRIVEGPGSFEDQEDELQKLDSYRKVFKDVYPKLRTAKTEVLVVKPKKTAAEISVLAKQVANGQVSADTLTAEEMMYAGTLTASLEEKKDIYMAATKKNGAWNAHNNLGAVYIQMYMQDMSNSQYLDMAATQFELSNRKEQNAYAQGNLAVVYAMQGQGQKAYDLAKEATKRGNPAEVVKGVNGVKGSLEIMMGMYDAAQVSCANAEATPQNMFNKALAFVLDKDYESGVDAASEAIAGDANYAKAYYLSAVANARLQNEARVLSSLRKAFQLDANLKEVAKNDLEFSNYIGTEGFRGLF